MTQTALTLRALALASRRLVQPLIGSKNLNACQLGASGQADVIMQLRAFSAKAQLEPQQPEGMDDESSDKVRTSWVLKALTFVTLSYVGYNAVPLMGDSLVSQSVALCRAKDPFLQRSGAYRIHVIATNDRRRERIVEAGGLEVLLALLDSTDEATAREAAKTLAGLAQSSVAAEAMQKLGAESIIKRVTDASSDLDIREHTDVLLQLLNEQTKGEIVEQM